MLHNFEVVDFNRPEAFDIDYLFEQILPSLGVSLLLGKSSCGKTAALLHTAYTLATRKPFGNFKGDKVFEECHSPFHASPMKKGSTILFVGEDKHDCPARVVASEILYTPEQLQSFPDGRPPIIIVKGGHVKLQDAKQAYELKEALQEQIDLYTAYGYPPRLLAFDTLFSCFFVKDQNNNAEGEAVMSALNIYAEVFQCHVMATMHPAKSSRADKTLNSGAAAYFNRADAVLQMSSVNQTPARKIRVVKTRNSPSENAVAQYRITGHGNVPLLQSEKSHAALAANNSISRRVYHKEIVAFMKENGAASLDEMAKGIKPRRNTKPESMKKRLKERIAEMIDNGEAKKIGDPVSSQKARYELTI